MVDGNGIEEKGGQVDVNEVNRAVCFSWDDPVAFLDSVEGFGISVGSNDVSGPCILVISD
jgi:hypothetical protein